MVQVYVKTRILETAFNMAFARILDFDSFAEVDSVELVWDGLVVLDDLLQKTDVIATFQFLVVFQHILAVVKLL